MLIRLMKMVDVGPATDYDVDSSTASVLESLRSRMPLPGIPNWKWADDQTEAWWHVKPIIKEIVEDACGPVFRCVKHLQRRWMITINDAGFTDNEKQLAVSRLLAIRKWFAVDNEDVILKLRDGKHEAKVTIFRAILPEDD